MRTALRRTLIVVVCFAVGFSVSRAVRWEAEPGPVPPTSQSTVPAQEPRLDARVVPGALDDDAAWVLMASEDLAHAEPPDDVTDCGALRDWALREGALPAGDAPHTIEVEANYRTTLEAVHVRVAPDPTPYSGKAPIVRLMCLPRPDSAPAAPGPDAVRFKVNGEPSPFDPVYKQASLPGRHEVRPRSPAELEVVIDLSGSPGPFAYRVEVDVVEQNEFRKIPVGEPLFATEDGGGMGYWPATATWTMSPDRTHTYCEPVRDPAPDAKPTCT
ncbi:hypothetical protein [Actinosynnema sp. NPDC023587]|uniref:hypothetical protein n=1 Tax=Actinosynnema sp. NPDC023587 TaxID=3154695 RepID=UPI0033FBD96D